MAIEIREFETMVGDTLRRITNSTKINNVRPGAVVRTMTEALLAELDIQYYQIKRIFDNIDLDTATGEDLERLIKILGVVRKNATPCTTELLFGRSIASTVDIPIPYGSIVSTRADGSGNVTEFIVTEYNAVLPAGELEVMVECDAVEAGVIYVPMNTVIVMNRPIMNIEYVNNPENIYGGSDIEDDFSLRERARNVFATLGKSTIAALEGAVLAIEGVQDVVCVDCARGVGTADMIVVTATIPPRDELKDQIEAVIYETKAAGIDVQVVYPQVVAIDINVDILNDPTDRDTIGQAILDFMATLGVGDMFIINQLEKVVLNVCTPQADIRTILPTHNLDITATQIARCGTITINGVVWDNGQD